MGDVPAGIYEHLVTDKLRTKLDQVDPELVQLGPLDPADAHEALTRHIAALTSTALRQVGGDGPEAISRQVSLANDIVKAIAGLSAAADTTTASIAEPAANLLAVVDKPTVPGAAIFPERPAIPLTTSALLVNGRGQPRIGYEVTRELASADDVDLLCAFIKWHGLRVLEKQLADLRARGGRLRVITTTYIGATDEPSTDLLSWGRRSRCPTRHGRRGCTPRPGSSGARPASPPRTSGRPTCRRPL